MIKNNIIDLTELGPILGLTESLTYHSSKTIYINEAGLYSLIMNSNALFAEEFQDMVYETILTNTWKYGSYQVENQLTEAVARLSIKDKETEEAERVVKEERLRAEEAERVAEEERLQRLRSEIEVRQN
jgi:prophage antirepressor-like protein